MRSTSTTPRSGRGADPDDYDRVMGVSSAQPSEMGRFGDRNVTDVERIDQGVANDSNVSTPVSSGLGNYPGVGVGSKGFGSSSLAECLERMGDVSGLAAPAACSLEGAAEYYLCQPYPRHLQSQTQKTN